MVVISFPSLMEMYPELQMYRGPLSLPTHYDRVEVFLRTGLVGSEGGGIDAKLKAGENLGEGTIRREVQLIFHSKPPVLFW
jgi:hypothetical protein